MESVFTKTKKFEAHLTTFPISRFDALDCIKRSWPFDKSNVADDVDEAVSSFPKNFITLVPAQKKQTEASVSNLLSKELNKSGSGAVLQPVSSSGLQLIQSAYSDSESASPSPSPSPGKKRKLSDGSDVVIGPSSSKTPNSNGALFGNSIFSPSSPASRSTLPIPSIEKRERTPIKLNLSTKQNGVTFLPRSLELNGKKNTFADASFRLIRPSNSPAEPSTPRLNGTSVHKVTADKGEIQPSTSGLQPGNSQSPNGLAFRKDLLLNGYMKQNGSANQSKFAYGTLKTERKRVLSERGEAAARFPIVDRQNLMMTWRDSRLLRPSGRNCGVGLHNYSNDCFLNAVLQAMLHTAPLARYVAEQHNSSLCRLNSCFACALGNHMRHAINSNSAFKPNWIHPYLRTIFPAHISGYQEDAHELFNLLLDALDPPTTTKQNGLPLHPNHMIDTRPSTPIEQIFGGTLRNQIRCTECMEIFINYERIRELNLGLRMKKRDVSTLTVEDLLTDYFATETFGQYECKKCKRKTQAQRSTRVLRAPNVLLVQLKRFTSFGSKIRTPVNMEPILRLDRFMYQPGDYCVYQLNAVIEHMGGGIDHGHYIAMVRGFDGKSWHLFDDDEIRSISLATLQQRQAYLMVYTKREGKPTLTNGFSGKFHSPRPKTASCDS